MAYETRLLADERSKYEEMWAIEDYSRNSPGERFAPIFLDMVRHRAGGGWDPAAVSVLDAGCGAGRGALALKHAGFQHVEMCDITAEGLCDDARSLPFHQGPLWSPLSARVDWVYCTDVLEHIPVQFTMLVVDQLLRASRRGVFLTICFHEDTYGIWIGKTLHETVMPFTWWRDNLDAVGCVVEARDMINNGAFLLVPRHVE